MQRWRISATFLRPYASFLHHVFSSSAAPAAAVAHAAGRLVVLKKTAREQAAATAQTDGDEIDPYSNLVFTFDEKVVDESKINQ